MKQGRQKQRKQNGNQGRKLEKEAWMHQMQQEGRKEKREEDRKGWKGRGGLVQLADGGLQLE